MKCPITRRFIRQACCPALRQSIGGYGGEAVSRARRKLSVSTCTATAESRADVLIVTISMGCLLDAAPKLDFFGLKRRFGTRREPSLASSNSTIQRGVTER